MTWDGSREQVNLYGEASMLGRLKALNIAAMVGGMAIIYSPPASASRTAREEVGSCYMGSTNHGTCCLCVVDDNFNVTTCKQDSHGANESCNSTQCGWNLCSTG